TNLQRYLRFLSRYDNRIPPIPIDGFFESRTEEALRAFQVGFGLPPTGIADQTTWDALYAEYLRLTEENDRTPRIHLFPKTPENYEAALGEESAFVAILQLLLNELRIIYDQIPSLSATGRFDETTQDAVKRFQEASHLPVTGRVDLRTWNRMLSDFDQYASDPVS
ncbi:MAG: peptidoglycan-binding protein, partial [Clostridia bacterium]|nr:peptidoglycan-binding protein [Clostridia bacterium]